MTLRALAICASIALRMVYRRPVRSLLAALGVAVVVAGLVIAESIGQRGADAARREIERIGADVITVSAVPARSRGGRARVAGVVTTLQERDARELSTVGGIRAVSAEYRDRVPLKVGALARQAVVAGVDPAYAALRDAPVARGRFFVGDDADAARRVAVLGARIAADMAGGLDAVGTELRLRGIPFLVIGVLPERGTGLDAFDEDETIFVPLGTARQRLFQQTYVQRIFVRVANADSLDEMAQTIRAALLFRHPVRPPDSMDVRIDDQRRLIVTRETTIARMRVFSIVVGIILITAGAAGIFGLQLLSVSERRTEIGTRRALGARRAHVFWQFAIEAGLVTVGGALAGVLLAALYAHAGAFDVDRRIMFGAFAACTVSGVVASLRPAWRASRVPPAVAIKSA